PGVGGVTAPRAGSDEPAAIRVSGGRATGDKATPWTRGTASTTQDFRGLRGGETRGRGTPGRQVTRPVPEERHTHDTSFLRQEPSAAGHAHFCRRLRRRPGDGRGHHPPSAPGGCGPDVQLCW